MTKNEALQMCLEYIETNAHERRHVRWAIKEALAQTQEPVATLFGSLPVYDTTTPQRIEQEPVQQVGTIGHIGNGSTTLTRAIAPLLSKAQAQAQPEQEPVAWRTFDGEGGYDYRSYEDNESYADEWDKRNPNHKGWVDKLYTPPPPCPTCEALARTVMMDQTGRDA